MLQRPVHEMQDSKRNEIIGSVKADEGPGDGTKLQLMRRGSALQSANSA